MVSAVWHIVCGFIIPPTQYETDLCSESLYHAVKIILNMLKCGRQHRTIFN